MEAFWLVAGLESGNKVNAEMPSISLLTCPTLPWLILAKPYLTLFKVKANDSPLCFNRLKLFARRQSVAAPSLMFRNVT